MLKYRFLSKNILYVGFFLQSTHFLEKSPPLLCTDLKQGGNFSHFENFSKNQVLECSEKLKNEVLSNLEGVDF